MRPGAFVQQPHALGPSYRGVPCGFATDQHLVCGPDRWEPRVRHADGRVYRPALRRDHECLAFQPPGAGAPGEPSVGSWGHGWPGDFSGESGRVMLGKGMNGWLVDPLLSCLCPSCPCPSQEPPHGLEKPPHGFWDRLPSVGKPEIRGGLPGSRVVCTCERTRVFSMNRYQVHGLNSRPILGGPAFPGTWPLTLTLSPPRDPWSANWGRSEGSGSAISGWGASPVAPGLGLSVTRRRAERCAGRCRPQGASMSPSPRRSRRGCPRDCGGG